MGLVLVVHTTDIRVPLDINKERPLISRFSAETWIRRTKRPTMGNFKGPRIAIVDHDLIYLKELFSSSENRW